MAMQMSPPPPPLPSLTLFLCLSLALLLPPRPASAVSSSPSFSLDLFPAGAAIAQLALSGGASANATSGAVSMPIPGARVQYRTPIAASALRPGFSTYFSFALPSAPSSSLALFFTPSAGSASRSPPALALVFSARHVRLDLAGRTALRTETHHPFHHGHAPRPARRHAHPHHQPSLHPAAALLPAPSAPRPPQGGILAGFRTSSGNCTLFTWAFRAAPNRMHSLPLNPADLLTTPPPERVASARAPALDRRYSSPWGAALSLLLAAAAGAMLTFIVLFLWYSVAKRRPVAPVEYPMHPSHLVYEKIVLVGVKDDAAVADSAGN
ncbi:unnamed protein product [Miscanthus lutarioriparius]|uniref:Legume lectin domain-containing protein n=1 Tax=Miscanthus lutarioriparius TaxID=422564 RepID=A0A811NVG5_9POAL|nr:unnamed protein product [Miscanthus lutarioriparius]